VLTYVCSDSDPLCLSFSVARTPVLAANEYRYDKDPENCVSLLEDSRRSRARLFSRP